MSRSPAPLPPRLLSGLLISLIALGIVLRLVNLDQKPYWFDETFTSLWVSGHALQAARQTLFSGELLSVADLQAYQTLDPSSTLMDTVLLLAEYDPQHPPLYYVIVRLWVNLFGTSVTAIRGISALLSLLALPGSYWLGLELFQSRFTALIVVALVAISPAMILYAQEAREYGLWIGMILVSSAAFLRALRYPAISSWGLYGVSLFLGFCTFPFTLFVALAHGLYLLVLSRGKPGPLFVRYSLALVTSLVLFSPWLIRILTGPTRYSLAWTATSLTGNLFASRWLLNISRVFLDLGAKSYPPAALFALALVTLSSLGYIVVTAIRQGPRQTRWLIVLLGGTTALGLLIPDLLLGGRRSVIFRYLIPTWLSLLLLTASYLGTVLAPSPTAPAARWQRRVGLLLGLALGAACLISNGVYARADQWWHKESNASEFSAIAETIHRAPQPLVVSGDFEDTVFGQLMAISHTLNPEVLLLLFPRGEPLKIPDWTGTRFVLLPTDATLQLLQQAGYSLKLENPQSLLWRVE